MSVSTSSPSLGWNATPTLPPSSRLTPSATNGSASARRIALATRMPSSGVAAGRTRTPNSAPPRGGAGAHEDAELVAAEAGDGVARVEQLGEPAGHLAQDLVAVVVAERVVDVLEAVEVDEHHDDGAVAAVRGRDRAARAVGEQHAVRQPGERVVERQAAADERVRAGALDREERQREQRHERERR